MIYNDESIEKVLSTIKLDIFNFGKSEEFDITVNFEVDKNDE